jgi:hypothetical protein
LENLSGNIHFFELLWSSCPMNVYTEIAEAVEAAASTATVDWSAPREPFDERVRFDVQRLRVATASIRSPDALNAAVVACEDVVTRLVRQWRPDLPDRATLEANALAALVLIDRLTAPHRSGYRDAPGGFEPRDL